MAQVIYQILLYMILLIEIHNKMNKKKINSISVYLIQSIYCFDFDYFIEFNEFNIIFVVLKISEHIKLQKLQLYDYYEKILNALTHHFYPVY